MAGKTTSLLVLLLLSFASTLLIGHSTSQNDRKAYIVYMGNIRDEVSTSSRYTSMLQDVIGRFLHLGEWISQPFVSFVTQVQKQSYMFLEIAKLPGTFGLPYLCLSLMFPSLVCSSLTDFGLIVVAPKLWPLRM
ncbi:hypothetical protein CFP56_032662 [Quercus suber]|uniref:Uncharacterized protein n=1 Tax=Quercus suber TaxID=58331 RepID=A0AAW0JG71_QUESU